MENKVLPGALRLFYNGWLNEKHSMQLIRCAHRAECDMNPIVYCKAVRATLLALGFNPRYQFQLSQERQNRLLLSRLGGGNCGNDCGSF